MKISSIFKSKEQKQVLHRLSKFVDSEALEKIAAGKMPDFEIFKEGIINFLITQVKDTPLSSFQALQSDVITTILENKGFVDCIMSSIIIATFGFPFEDRKNAGELCENTARTLLNLRKHDIRIIYGEEKGTFGNIGCSRLFRYGPLISNVDRKLSLLNKLEYGKLLKV